MTIFALLQHPFALLALFATFVFVLPMIGPFFSDYRYAFEEDGFRISVKLLGVIPTPGVLVPYYRILNITKVGAWASPLLILMNLFGLIFSAFFFLAGRCGPFNLYQQWGSIWKSGNNVALTISPTQRHLFTLSFIDHWCGELVVTPENSDAFIARVAALSHIPLRPPPQDEKNEVWRKDPWSGKSG